MCTARESSSTRRYSRQRYSRRRTAVDFARLGGTRGLLAGRGGPRRGTDAGFYRPLRRRLPRGLGGGFGSGFLDRPQRWFGGRGLLFCRLRRRTSSAAWDAHRRRRRRGGGRAGGGRGAGGGRRRLGTPARICRLRLRRRLGLVRGFLLGKAAAASHRARRRGGQQRAAVFKRQRLGIAVLGDARVLLAIADVRAVAAVEHLNAVDAEVVDDAVGIGELLGLDAFERPLERHGVRVVVLERNVLAAEFDVGAEAADVGEDRLAFGRRAERARQNEQRHRLLERDRVHLLPGAQAGEARLLRIVLGADLHERAEAAHAHRHGFAGGRVAAELARLRHLFTRDVLLNAVDLADEGFPEFRQRRGPGFLAARHGVELIFHRGGEAIVDVLVKMLAQEAVDDLADVGGREAAIINLHVFAIAQRGDDRGIGRRPADAVLLERLDQRSLGEARRWLGKMLLRLYAEQLHYIADLHRRQHLIAFIVGRIVAAFLIDGDVSRFDQRRAVGAQYMALGPIGARQHVDRDRIEQRVRHLAGDGAFPDQRIELELIGLEVTLNVGRDDAGRGRANGLVCFLRVLGFRLVYAHLFGHRLCAIEFGDDLADLLHRFGRKRHRIGAHVGD